MGCSLFRVLEQVNYEKAIAEPQGLAGWIIGLWRSWLGLREVQIKQKQMRLLETLPLGGKRQLMLVSCGGERFCWGWGGECGVDRAGEG